MNAISFAGDMFQLTTPNKTMLLVAVVAFGMICVYRMVTGSDWLGKVLGVVLLVIAVNILAGCSDGPTNPLGMTDRTRLRTDASVSIARSDADARARVAEADERARIAQAQAEQAARISEANAQIIAEQSKQNGETARATTWAGMIPLALLIVGAAMVVALVVNWQGRIFYERTRQGQQMAQNSPGQHLTAKQVQLLQDHAARTGQWLVRQSDGYYLTDGQHTVKALLKG